MEVIKSDQRLYSTGQDCLPQSNVHLYEVIDRVSLNLHEVIDSVTLDLYEVIDNYDRTTTCKQVFIYCK